MTMSLPFEEPPAGPWRVGATVELVEAIYAQAGVVVGRPVVVAIDGRSGGGKSTLAEALRRGVTHCGVVHTDDVGWKDSWFGWAPLLASGVLEPARSGQPVSYRPPAWVEHGREGYIEVPTGLNLLVIEGVGAGQRNLAHLVDAVVWVQSDVVESERRGIARDVAEGVNGNEAAATQYWHDWAAQEFPFLAAERPWDRACAFVAGTPVLTHAPGEVVLAAAPSVQA